MLQFSDHVVVLHHEAILFVYDYTNSNVVAEFYYQVIKKKHKNQIC